MQSRTHTCGELRIENAGEKVKLVGWMENLREVGAELGFVVLRDFYGTTQVVVENEEMMKYFLKKHKDMEVMDERFRLPDDIYDGFYICKMKKRDE